MCAGGDGFLVDWTPFKLSSRSHRLTNVAGRSSIESHRSLAPLVRGVVALLRRGALILADRDLILTPSRISMRSSGFRRRSTVVMTSLQ